eukprot:349964-Chlamydomonas_euryale.AAC.1
MAQPPLAEWIRRGQPAHTPPQRPPGAERKGRHKGRKNGCIVTEGGPGLGSLWSCRHRCMAPTTAMPA